METKVNRREWVKTAAIIFLAVLLVLTFFSNTFMNHSLPQAATEQTQSGTINAKIRGDGTVSANEEYEVTIRQSRKVASVLAREGQAVSAGDVLLVLEAEDSDELKTAEAEYAAMKDSYDKALIEAGNAAASSNYELKQAQQAYDEALEIYTQYSDKDAAALTKEIAAAESKLNDLKSELSKAENAYNDAVSDPDYTTAQSSLGVYQGEMDSLDAEIDALELQVIELQSGKPVRTRAEIGQDIAAQNQAIAKFEQDNAASVEQYAEYYDTLSSICSGKNELMLYYKGNSAALRESLLASGIPENAVDEYLKNVLKAYDLLGGSSGYYEKQHTLQAELSALQSELAAADEYEGRTEKIAHLQEQIQQKQKDRAAAKRNLDDANAIIGESEEKVSKLKKAKDKAQTAVTEQQTEFEKLSKASAASETVKSTQAALEKLLFEQTLGDAGSIDLQAQKTALTNKQAELEELRGKADQAEVKASVNGTVASIAVSAGQTANAEAALMTIHVTDRGYTIKIPVKSEQAKKVKIGETADIVNYWWGSDVSATLESIERDPSNPSSGKLLVFRIDGDVEPGQSLTLSIGQKSSNYDCLVPNAAIRTGNNGTYVLVLTVKNSPLGNRYTVTEVPVQVLASDDMKTAVSGLGSGEFVVTTSSEPLKNGQQVRLPENT